MAANSTPRNRRPKSVGAFLRSLRSPSNNSEFSGSTSQNLHIPAHLAVPGPLGTDIPVQGDEIAGLPPSLPAYTPRASNNCGRQTLPVNSVSPASGSTSPMVRLPTSQPLLAERIAIYPRGQTRQGEATLTTPYEPRQRDLWGRAAEASDASTLKKLQSLNPSPTNSIEIESVTNVLESTRARARLQQNRIWKQRWLSLVRSVSRFKSLIDAGLQFDPTGYGALAWSALSFGLEAAISYDETDNDLLESCEYLRAIIEKYAIYEAQYLEVESIGRKGLENSIIDVYKVVIIYTAEMSQYIGSRTDRFSKAVKGSSASTFLEIRTLLDKRSTEAHAFIAEIRNELSESRLNSIQRDIADILSKADDISRIATFVDEQEREGVLTWISVTQMDTVHVTQRDKAEADDRQNPGSWILGNTEFLQWENAEETSSLWLCSGVGTGKTVLTSTVVEDRRRNNSGPMAYFYCSGAPGIEAGGMTAENILKCILRQFAECSEVSFSLVAAKWKELKSHGLRALTRMEVLKLISAIVEDEQTLVATIIVDGLDELTTDALRILLDSIATLSGLNYGILKIFASSRWNQRIEDHFVDGFLISNIASETSGDMRVYIESAVHAQTRGRQNIEFGLVDDIRRTLLERAKGMFRYIELAMKYIFDSTTSRIRERLEDLPYPASGEAVLRPMYQKLYEEIEGQDPVDQLLAHRVMQWLLHQIVPLTDKALLKAVSFGTNSRLASKLHRSHIGIDEVKAACHHLVVHNPQTSCFEFGHISVVEFIHWKSPLELSDMQAQSALAAACLAFLLSQKIPEKLRKPGALVPEQLQPHILMSDFASDFAYYSIWSWAWHWQEAAQNEHPTSPLMDLFTCFWNHDRLLRACIQAFHLTELLLPAKPVDRNHPLYLVRRRWKLLAPILIKWAEKPLQQRWLLACGQDLFTAANIVLESTSKKTDSLFFVPGIKLAVAFGSTRLLDLINSRYYDFAQLHGSGTSLLLHAANLQNAQSTRKCLEISPDAINLKATGAIKDEWAVTPVLMNLRSIELGGQDLSQLEVFKILLEQPEVDLDVRDQKGHTLLQIVVRLNLGRDSIESFLERSPRAIFRRDMDGLSGMTTAIHAADHLSQEQTLLSVQAQTYPAYNLHNAARTGDIDMLKEEREAHNAMGPIAHQDLLLALFFAAEKQNMECVKTVLSSPYVDVNDQDEDGFSALMVATIAGKDYAVMKLRLQGANVVLETSAGRNALFFAIRAKRLAVLKALLHPMPQSPFDINNQDSKTGKTPLHYACEKGVADEMDWARASNRDVVSEILSHNPDIEIRDKSGKTARDVAVADGLELTDLLGNAEAPSAVAGGWRNVFKRLKTSQSLMQPAHDTEEEPTANATDFQIDSFCSFESFDQLCEALTKT